MKQLFLILLILCFSSHPCFAGRQAKTRVKKGNLLYNQDEFKEALKEYTEALRDSPDSDIVNFNTGAAFYKIEDYQKAISHFEKSLLSENQSLEQKASYNIGNTKFKYGINKEEVNLPEAINLLEQALHHYQRALELEPEDEDVEYNYEFVKNELERLEEKLKQQQQQRQTQEEKQEQQNEEVEGQQQEAQRQQIGQGQTKEEAAKKMEDQEQPQAQQSEQDIEKEKQIESATLQEEGDKEKQLSEQVTEVEQSKDEISKQEALMLLESYRQEEEPKGLYKEKIPTRGLPEVLKDW
ncbi:MAG: tetratricopeptide repeat protein [Candidatus Omnitrophica bacterium]|nr:tetratricopeptide repeat protein [Candidatus Omnitrophota bacterium]